MIAVSVSGVRGQSPACPYCYYLGHNKARSHRAATDGNSDIAPPLLPLSLCDFIVEARHNLGNSSLSYSVLRTETRSSYRVTPVVLQVQAATCKVD